MAKNGHRLLIGKIFFKGDIVLKVGLHVGGSSETMQIGGIDLPVIRDSSNNIPYIPGSSLKGKLRSTLEKFGKREKDGRREKLLANRDIGSGRNKLYIHCCDDIKDALKCDVCRIFGSSGDDRSVVPKGSKAENLPSLLFVRDCLLDQSQISSASVLTEVKVETGIDRVNMAANPRRVERVLPGNKFKFEMVYTVDALGLSEKEKPSFDKEVLKTNLDNIFTCMKIIQSEGLGGYSSRGYGKIAFDFSEFSAKSLNYYMGDKDKKKGKTNGYFSLDDARGEIDSIVKFLEEESKSVIAG